MKITRQKHVKKHLSFYRNNFRFREPYQVLLDGTFCQAALKNKIQIKEQLPKYFTGDVQLCTSNCVLKELQSLGKELFGAKLIAQRFQVRHCAHFKSPVSGSACLLSMVAEGNAHHYFIATQDQELASKVKKQAGVPLLFIIQNTIVLDKPSPTSLAHVQAVQAGQLVPEHQKQNLQQLKDEQGVSQIPERRGRKRRGVRGPNPLSCMKKKRKNAPQAASAAPDQKKRKRKRNRGKSLVQDTQRTM
ncbi:rRNA-processing protein UTP23 homolog [Pseudophryne corroboree]|uniref:rRNA-processing protein UTP23 homolog n=1 Tax=Pseudophryne corroboree TaxID=495146 RepID=UPI0030813603